MNYLALTRQLRQMVGAAGDGPASITDGMSAEYRRLADWIATANSEIENKWLDWKFLWAEGSVPLVAGTAAYTLAADLALLRKDTLRLDLTTRPRYLTMVPWETYRECRDAYDGMAPGEPEFFTMRPDRKLLVFPTPAAAVTLRYEYQRASRRLTANSDTPRIPEAYQDAILWRGKMFWCEFEEDQPGYQSANANFAQAMLRLEASELPSDGFQHGIAYGVGFQVVAE